MGYLVIYLPQYKLLYLIHIEGRLTYLKLFYILFIDHEIQPGAAED